MTHVTSEFGSPRNRSEFRARIRANSQIRIRGEAEIEFEISSSQPSPKIPITKTKKRLGFLCGIYDSYTTRTPHGARGTAPHIAKTRSLRRKTGLLDRFDSADSRQLCGARGRGGAGGGRRPPSIPRCALHKLLPIRTRMGHPRSYARMPPLSRAQRRGTRPTTRSRRDALCWGHSTPRAINTHQTRVGLSCSGHRRRPCHRRLARRRDFGRGFPRYRGNRRRRRQ